MNRVRSRLLCSTNDLVDDQIALSGWSRSNVNRFIGHAHVQGNAIRIRVDRNRGDAHFDTCPDDTHRNLTSVCNQDLFEHEVTGSQYTVPSPEGRG